MSFITGKDGRFLYNGINYVMQTYSIEDTASEIVCTNFESKGADGKIYNYSTDGVQKATVKAKFIIATDQLPLPTFKRGTVLSGVTVYMYLTGTKAYSFSSLLVLTANLNAEAAGAITFDFSAVSVGEYSPPA